MGINVVLDNFSGPLDLLLQLIRDNAMDIYDIQIVEITDQYLRVIEQMQRLDLDLASEFLLMAATLIHIKSRMLLPVAEEEGEEDGDDPRTELVRRLLEYQRYKEVAAVFEELPQLNRDLFFASARAGEWLELETEEDEISVGIYQLAEAFQYLLNNMPVEVFHEVVRESLSVAEFVCRIADRLLRQERVAFREFFQAGTSRDVMVVTFLAMLELVKMRMINIEQTAEFRDIWLSPAVTPEVLGAVMTDEAALGYG